MGKKDAGHGFDQAITTIRRGLEIPAACKPAQKIPGTVCFPPAVALLGADCHGLRPALAVHEGERVEAGQALFIGQGSPGSGFRCAMRGHRSGDPARRTTCLSGLGAGDQCQRQQQSGLETRARKHPARRFRRLNSATGAAKEHHDASRYLLVACRRDVGRNCAGRTRAGTRHARRPLATAWKLRWSSEWRLCLCDR